MHTAIWCISLNPFAKSLSSSKYSKEPNFKVIRSVVKIRTWTMCIVLQRGFVLCHGGETSSTQDHLNQPNHLTNNQTWSVFGSFWFASLGLANPQRSSRIIQLVVPEGSQLAISSSLGYNKSCSADRKTRCIIVPSRSTQEGMESLTKVTSSSGTSASRQHDPWHTNEGQGLGQSASDFDNWNS